MRVNGVGSLRDASRQAAPVPRELLTAKPHVSQSGARKLTDAEKATVREWAVRREMERHPNAKVTITVRDEVDGNGNARYTALVLTEEVAEGVVGDRRTENDVTLGTRGVVMRHISEGARP